MRAEEEQIIWKLQLDTDLIKHQHEHEPLLSACDMTTRPLAAFILSVSLSPFIGLKSEKL